MSKRREINVFNIAFLDLLSGALGAVIILYLTVPKSKVKTPDIEDLTIKQSESIEKQMLKISSLENTLKKTQQEKKQLQEEVKTLQEQTQQITKENQKLKTSQQAISTKPKTINESKLDVDIGFKFKGKYIVFIIDVSGSMHKEDRIGQVKAGLKMLITAMGDSFYIDVLNYPHGTISDFRPLWGHMKQTTKMNKEKIYQFLQTLKPYGATPTRSVLKHVLQNYSHITDIVLLTDGAPTKSNSKSLDSIDDVLKEVRHYNGGRVQINAIGVGSDFISNKENAKYLFLRKLSTENQGFFVGF